MDLRAFFELPETLIAAGHLDLRAYEERREKVSAREAERMNREGHVHVLLNEVPDKYALTGLPEIDCESRLPLCKARCCTLGFPLSVQDSMSRTCTCRRCASAAKTFR